MNTKSAIGDSAAQREIGIVRTRLSGDVAKRIWVGLWLIATIALGGCVSQETKRDAINDINRAFKEEYEAILARSGTRFVSARAGETFDATAAALVSLGMEIRQESRGLGFINADAAAPLPLSRGEWDRAVRPTCRAHANSCGGMSDCWPNSSTSSPRASTR